MTRSARTPRRIIGPLLVALLLAQLLAAGAFPTATPLHAQVADPTLTPDAALFADQLRRLFLEKDYAALEALMADPFRLATFQGVGRMLTPAEAIEEIELDILGPAPAPLFDDENSVAAWFGVPTTAVWGDGIEVVGTLYARQLNADALGDGLLAIAVTDEGDYRWGGLLLAPGGFGLPPVAQPDDIEAEPAPPTAEPPFALPAGAVPADIPAIRIVRTTNVYPAPDPDAAPLGLLRREQSVTVLGASEDGEYYLIECPATLDEECWVVADPGAVQPGGFDDGLIAPATALPPAGALQAGAAGGQGGRPFRIGFDEGATEAALAGVVAPDAPRYYVLRAQAGQALTIALDSTTGGANFTITGVANGQPYKSSDSAARTWSFTVPVTQDYLITVESADATDFDLNVVLLPLGQAAASPTAPPTPTDTPTSTPASTPTPLPTPTAPPLPTAAPAAEAAAPAPERIRFALGQTTTERTGTVTPDEQKQYIFNIMAGQTVTIEFMSGGAAASYSLIGDADGVLYKAMALAADEFTFESPLRQDYLLTIATGAPTEYALTISAPPLPTPTATPTPEPLPDLGAGITRLRIPPGETAVSVTEIVIGYGANTYAVRAQAGQQMDVTLRSPESIVNFSLVGYDDDRLLKSLNDEARFWSGGLPATQDYLIRVDNPRAVRVQYTLRVELSSLADASPPPTATPLPPPTATANPPLPTATPLPTLLPTPVAERIRLATGSTTATLAGSVPLNGEALYVARAQAGQQMDVALFSASPVYLTVYGADGTVLISPMAGASMWSGVLPVTQDYYVAVRAQAGQSAGYVLTIAFAPLAAGATATPRPNAPPQRIAFAAGAESEMVSGAAPDGGAQSYILRALRGQTMIVELYPTAAATFSVAGSDGAVLKSSGAGGMVWSGALPSTQDYIITVAPQDGPIEFDLIVTVTH